MSGIFGNGSKDYLEMIGNVGNFYGLLLNSSYRGIFYFSSNSSLQILNVWNSLF